MSLVVSNLKVRIDGKDILKGVSLEVKSGRRSGRTFPEPEVLRNQRSSPEGELHVLMGPNGSGKSTLAQTIMGNPKFAVDSGQIAVSSQDITKLSPDKRARLGLFLAFQNPVEVPGVSYFNFLRLAVRDGKNGKNNGIIEFKNSVTKTAQSLGFEENLLSRSLNDGFSGGEKRKSEILQALTLKPKYAILDEPDSGLDVDGQKIMSAKISELVKAGTGVLLITHNPRILKFLKPDKVYVMIDGQIVKSGGFEIVTEVETKGFKGDIIYSA